MRNTTFNNLHRSLIGFDRLASMLNEPKTCRNDNYPPFNIENQGEGKYRITLAVAGFEQTELDIEENQQKLVVKGQKQRPAETNDEKPRKFIHQGIGQRNFEKTFELGENVKVLDAHLELGILHIDLEKQLPETQQPKKVAIKQLESDSAKNLAEDLQH